ncbi:MAG: 2-amino-4-hydroxy-6-hydroxymethyldihydropteridine diphosphokinase [Gammaproteobacteria bacterium]|nr:2-amino-4-hydroxy-6-hydroxymethyldihydropteridine diphosphokinase [Gammaproteobacteria bacterium]
MAGPSPVDVYVSVGSNVAPLENLRLALAELRRRFGPLDVSSVYRNPAVGFVGDDFLNLVLRFRTAESPATIIAELERLHVLAGRVRGPDPFSSRTLDLDLLLYGDAVLPDPAIRVPREDIRKYAFVLGPLAELAPELSHPETGETMAGLWAGFDRAGHQLQRVPDPFS